MTNSSLTRRSFIKTSTLAGGGLLMSFSLFGMSKHSTETADEDFVPNAYIKITPNGEITILAPNPEIGQGTKTSLPLIIAEEMGASWEKIKVEFAPLDEKFGRQVAGGSGAIRGRYQPLRIAGATAREMLIAAAAKTWEVPAEECIAIDGLIKHDKSKLELSFGDLATKASKVSVPTEPKLKDSKDFKYLGTRVNDVDAHKITTGQPLYGSDFRKEGMYFTMVARPPAYGKVLKSLDDSEALSVNGVFQIVQLENSVAVLATSTWAAKKGREALKLVWETDGNLENTEAHFTSFKETLASESGSSTRNDGDIDQANVNAIQILDSYYEMPSLAHGQMEPLNYYADVKNDRAELFGPTQVPASVRSEVSRKLNIPEENISVSLPRQGGGFGRKLMNDNGVEAAMISAAAKKPVLVQWTREDDMQTDFFRPATMYRYKAGISKDSLLTWFQAGIAIGRGVRGDSYVAGALDNYRSESHGYNSNTPTGWWRAPGANTLAFPAEGFMDEVCVALKKDPIKFRLELFEKATNLPVGNLGYDPNKYISTIKLVAEMSNWGTSPKDIYRGFATWYSFGSYASQVVDLKMIDGQPRVTKVYCAVHCGRVINLSGAENQVQGAIVDGICHAMFPKITFIEGKVQETNFNSYKFLRIKDAPLDIEVKFVPSNEAPTGLGEPALPPIAPAIASAIFSATGKRLRKMPFMDNF